MVIRLFQALHNRDQSFVILFAQPVDLHSALLGPRFQMALRISVDYRHPHPAAGHQAGQSRQKGGLAGAAFLLNGADHVSHGARITNNR